MTLRDQRQAEFAKAWKDKGEYGILYLCPRFGKIRTSINVLKEFPKDASVLIAYPDNKIKQSWLDDFEALGYDNDNITFTLEGLNLTDEFQDQWVDSRADRLSYYHHTGRQYFMGMRYQY